MQRRYVSVWFPRLKTDWFLRRQSELNTKPFALTFSDHGRILVGAVNAAAESAGIFPGFALADARVLEPSLVAEGDRPGLGASLLELMADWCIRYTPIVALDETTAARGGPDGLFLDITGCAHLLGGEAPLLKDLVTRFIGFGYAARAALADTPGAAWAVARYGRERPIIPSGGTAAALASLPPQALRLPPETVLTLRKLGLHSVRHLSQLPRAALNRRFGAGVSLRLAQALGEAPEPFPHHRPLPDYSAKLGFPEGAGTREAIVYALKKLLATLCAQLEEDQKGLRALQLQCFRLDGLVETAAVGTGLPSRSPRHLFRLFEEKISTLAPGPGIELFILSAGNTAPLVFAQNPLGGMKDEAVLDPAALAELMDRLGARLGKSRLYRFAPLESHWPDSCVRRIPPSAAAPVSQWPRGKPRPVHLLPRPEKIDVMAPVPDDPPVLFRHKGALHRIRLAAGPERLEAEWWRSPGVALGEPARARDYYRLEDEAGRRYWVFREGHYASEQKSRWYLHGYFG